MRRTDRRAALTLALVLLACPAIAADLRDLTLGMKVSALPRNGYGAFTCAEAPTRRIAAWSDYASCPADQAGLHEIGFQFTEDEETKVGGHKVMLTAMLDDHGTLAGLRIVTDSKVPLYMRKKAFLMANQARAHYGDQGWTCTETPPSATEQPIGSTYYNGRCTKTADGRRYTVTQELHHDPAKKLIDFVSRSEVTIMAAAQ